MASKLVFNDSQTISVVNDNIKAKKRALSMIDISICLKKYIYIISGRPGKKSLIAFLYL